VVCPHHCGNTCLIFTYKGCPWWCANANTCSCISAKDNYYQVKGLEWGIFAGLIFQTVAPSPFLWLGAIPLLCGGGASMSFHSSEKMFINYGFGCPADTFVRTRQSSVVAGVEGDAPPAAAAIER
jgi:hypothetical protein